MEKQERHTAIQKLIRIGALHNQEELRGRLAEMGFEVTQATLSRDLKELRIVKVRHGESGYRYAELEPPAHSPIRRLESSGNLLVLHTEAGMAPVVAYRIDDKPPSGVLGTVAGEDTLIVVLAEDASKERIKKIIWESI